MLAVERKANRKAITLSRPRGVGSRHNTLLLKRQNPKSERNNEKGIVLKRVAPGPVKLLTGLMCEGVDTKISTSWIGAKVIDRKCHSNHLKM